MLYQNRVAPLRRGCLLDPLLDESLSLQTYFRRAIPSHPGFIGIGKFVNVNQERFSLSELELSFLK